METKPPLYTLKWTVIVTDRSDSPPSGLTPAVVDHIPSISAGTGLLTPLLHDLLLDCSDHALCMVECKHSLSTTISLLATTPAPCKVSTLAWVSIAGDKGFCFPHYHCDSSIWRFSLEFLTGTRMNPHAITALFRAAWEGTTRSYLPEDYRVVDGLLRGYRGDVREGKTIHTLGGNWDA